MPHEKQVAGIKFNTDITLLGRHVFHGHRTLSLAGEFFLPGKVKRRPHVCEVYEDPPHPDPLHPLHPRIARHTSLANPNRQVSTASTFPIKVVPPDLPPLWISGTETSLPLGDPNARNTLSGRNFTSASAPQTLSLT